MSVPASLLTALVLVSVSGQTCKCGHGTPGTTCTADGEENCVSCKSGFTLVSDKCELSYDGLGYMATGIKEGALKGGRKIKLGSTSGLSDGMTIKITSELQSEHNKIAKAKNDKGFTVLENTLKYNHDEDTTVVTAEESSWSSLGGQDRACRIDASDSTVSGDGTVQKHSNVYSVDECKRLCHMKIGCTGVEFQSSTGHCEIWTQAIGYTVSKPGFECWRHGQDCDTDLSLFELKWPRAKKIWCCYQEGKGCSSKHHEPNYQAGIGYYWEKVEDVNMNKFVTWERRSYDCNTKDLKLETWNEEWTYAHKLWCCKTEGLPNEADFCHQDTSNMAPSKPSKQDEYYWQKLGEDGFSFWNATHKGFHWKKVEGTFVEVPFNCDADLDRFERVWTSDQKEWCCKFLLKGCSESAKKPIYDAGDGKYWKKELSQEVFKEWKPAKAKYHCDADLERFELMWAPKQKKWCCDELKKGCSYSDNKPKYPAGSGFFWKWDGKTWEREEEKFDCLQDVESLMDKDKEQRDWCCDNKQKGCDGDRPPHDYPPPQGTRWVKAKRGGISREFIWELMDV